MSNWRPHPHRKRQTGTQVSTAKVESALAQFLLFMVDAGFCGILFVAPLFFAGRHDMGRLVIVLLSIMVSLAWCWRQIALGGGTRMSTRIHGILGLAIGLVVLQLAPLPGRWIEVLSPRTTSLLPLWTAHAHGGPSFGAWHTLSLTPGATHISLVMLLAYGLLLLTALERFRKITDIQRLLNWVALASIGMGIFALIEYFTSNGLFCWFYELPFRQTGSYPQGSFANRNHFAHFLVLGVGPLLAWLVRWPDNEKIQSQRGTIRAGMVLSRQTNLTKIGLAAGLVTVIFAILLSLSRGGALSLAVACITTLLLFHRTGQTTSQTFFVAVGMVVLMLGILSIYGYDKVAGRLDDLSAGSIDEVDSHAGRRKIWSANLAAIRAGGLFGSGAGSHRDIYRIYLAEPHPQEYTHAENGYLQITTENGLLGAGLLLLAIGTIGAILFQAIRHPSSPESAICTAAVAASLAASLVHSMVDFVWYIPACMSVTLLLVACAVNLSRLGLSRRNLSKQNLSKRSRASQDASHGPKGFPAQGRVWASKQWWLAAAFATLLLGAWMTTEIAGPAVASIHWDRYLRASIADTKLEQTPAKNLLGEESNIAASHDMVIAEMMGELQQVVYWYPGSARAHLRLASRHLQQFDLEQLHSGNAMGISQIRDAAMASGFTSSQELCAWLMRAFGENCRHLYQAYRHAWQAVRLDPLQGEAYLHLANLCFLAGQPYEAIDAYVDQSLRVRPQETNVLFEAGKQQLLLGHYEKAVTYWTRAFASQGPHQRQIVQHMAGQISAATFMDVFHPDWQTLGMVWTRYREVGQPEDLRLLTSYAVRTAAEASHHQTLAKQAHIWLTLAFMQSQLDQTSAALVSLRKAYQVAPSNYSVRHALGFALLKSRQFHSAQAHLHWCLTRKPGDKNLQAALIRAAKGSLADPVLIARQPTGQPGKNTPNTHSTGSISPSGRKSIEESKVTPLHTSPAVADLHQLP